MDAHPDNDSQKDSKFYLTKASPIETSLWRDFRSGSRKALNEIYDQHSFHLYAYAKGITADKALISDCIQDLFVQLWIKRETLTDDVFSVKLYLMRSLRRMILRKTIQGNRIKVTDVPESYDTVVEFNIETRTVEREEEKERSNSLNAAISDLSSRQKEAIALKFYQNLSYEEIASIMNTDVKAVYNLIGRSILSLRKALK